MLYAIAEAYRKIFGTPIHEEIVDETILHQAFLVGDGTVELSFHNATDKMMMSTIFYLVAQEASVEYDVVLEDSIVRIRLSGSSDGAPFWGIEDIMFGSTLPEGVHPIQLFLPGEEGPVPSFLRLTEEQQLALGAWVRKLDQLM
jgi:hypothetical protein